MRVAPAGTGPAGIPGGSAMKRIDSLIWALALVRIGQELGADSRLARAVREAIDAIIAGF